jgi:hypothetical protein
MIGLGLSISKIVNFISYLFKSLCSFSFDGVNDNFIIPNESLAATIQGPDVVVSFDFNFKINVVGESFTLFDANSPLSSDGNISRGILIYWDAINELRVVWGTNTRTVKFDIGTPTIGWHFLTVTIDIPNSNAYCYYDSVQVNGLFNNMSPAYFPNSGDSYFALGRNNPNYQYNGFINSFSVLNRTITLQEHIRLYNNGKPLNAKQLFPNDTVYNWIPQDALSFDTVNNEWAVPNSVNPPSFNKSMVFDGIDDEMAIPNASIRNVFDGTTEFTIGFVCTMVKDVSVLFAGEVNAPRDPYLIYTRSLEKLRFDYWNSDGVQNSVTFLNVIISEGSMSHIVFTVDILNGNGDLYINEVKFPSGTVAHPKAFFTTNVDYSIGNGIAGFSNYEGLINAMFLINRKITDLEATTIYNDGSLLNPIDIFGTDCKYLFNPENSVWNGSNYVNTDAVNNVIATSSNMVESSLKYRAPNLSYSQNMVLASKDCNENPY